MLKSSQDIQPSMYLFLVAFKNLEFTVKIISDTSKFYFPSIK